MKFWIYFFNHLGAKKVEELLVVKGVANLFVISDKSLKRGYSVLRLDNVILVRGLKSQKSGDFFLNSIIFLWHQVR
jgi:hypothetical protein